MVDIVGSVNIRISVNITITNMNKCLQIIASCVGKLDHKANTGTANMMTGRRNHSVSDHNGTHGKCP